ncbi:hypothetical protein Cgig2_027824 [Carnegiea gigantea]|uniref:acid phosphatase n=1 Tax=Carnegiea gigantea TaxID=171969 RepID=A0A9Q1K0P9_9CARY|nr:hypothetical protein Cgig2_027824 [Carnegiea gigantea]
MTLAFVGIRGVVLLSNSAAYQPWLWSVGNHEIEYMPKMVRGSCAIQVIPPQIATPYKASESTNPLWYAVRRASAHIIVLSSYSPFGKASIGAQLSVLLLLHGAMDALKYSPQYRWLKKELKNVDREKTPWLIVIMHVPVSTVNESTFYGGESMRSGPCSAYERSYRISNLDYKVSDGERYPVPDESVLYTSLLEMEETKEGLAGRDPQPDYSAFRGSQYGHSTLEIKNRTHAFYHWHRNDDGRRVAADSSFYITSTGKFTILMLESCTCAEASKHVVGLVGRREGGQMYIAFIRLQRDFFLLNLRKLDCLLLHIRAVDDLVGHFALGHGKPTAETISYDDCGLEVPLISDSQALDDL